MKKNLDAGLLVLRLSLGFLMLLHGINKITHGVMPIQQIIDLLEEKSLPSFLAFGVILGEFIAPILIIIGYRARIGAYLMCFNCVSAIFLAHAHQLLLLNKSGGWSLELLGVYFFGSLCLLFTGAGKYALSSNHYLD